MRSDLGACSFGETWVHDPDDFARYYDRGSALHLAFNFRFFDGRLNADELRSILAESLARVPGDWNAWAGSNHDHGRFTTRWCDGDRRRASCALVLLLTLPGTPVLYQGDEIAFPTSTCPESAFVIRSGSGTGRGSRVGTPAALLCSGVRQPAVDSPIRAPSHGCLWGTSER